MVASMCQDQQKKLAALDDLSSGGRGILFGTLNELREFLGLSPFGEIDTPNSELAY
jgi:hypothetical protein